MLLAANYLIAEKYVGALGQFATASNQKVMIVPMDTAGLAGTCWHCGNHQVRHDGSRCGSPAQQRGASDRTGGVAAMMGSFGLGLAGVGLGLIALEVLVIPGGFLLWIGIAALVMGGIVALFVLSWQLELVIFGLLALVASVAAWKLHHGHNRASDAAETRTTAVPA